MAKKRGRRARISRRVGPGPRGQEQGDETYVFELRAEWFRRFHGDRQGALPPEGRVQAIEHATTLGRFRLQELDPGGEGRRGAYDVIGGETVKARARQAKNPRETSSFGFAGPVVDVGAEGKVRGTYLRIALEKEAAQGIDPATVRIFRFDESMREWQIVPRSGTSATSREVMRSACQPA